ncbi:MAG: TonB-dependent receptor plug domain-containing protein [Nibricoccus sp.]
MKKHAMHRPVLMLLSLTLGSGVAWAQDVGQSNASAPQSNTSSVSPTPSAYNDLADDQVLVLDPFSVTTEHEGYKATDTLGGSRVRTKLSDTPSAISVITPKFMQDLGITNAQDLFLYTTSTEIAGINGNFSGVTTRGLGAVGAAEGSRLTNPAGTNRSRGITAMDSTRNYFVSQIPWDGFNISRVDISRGPNSFLFGFGSPSGISNVTTNEAVYKDKGAVEAHVGSFGTHRESVDYNKVLIPSELALRVDLVNDDTQYQQKPAYSHSKRVYGALRYDPQFLDNGSAHTKILANFEHGKVNSNNPRELSPLDYISGYFQGTNKGGYDPFTYNTGASSINYDPAASPWVTNADLMHYVWGNNAAYYFDAASGNLLRASQGGLGSPAGLQNQYGNGNTFHIFTAGFSQFAKAQDFSYPDSFPGAYMRSVSYSDKSLSDTSIFDFYNKLIDGENKREWQGWDAFNINVVQSFFENKLVFQGVVDHQEYNRGQEGLLTSYITPYISVDLDSQMITYPTWLPGAQTNPNLGRPFIGGDFGGGGNKSSDYTTDSYQLTGAYTLNFADFMGKSPLSNVLGRHEFTGLVGKYRTRNEGRTWQMYAMDTAYAQASRATDMTLSNRNISWVAYLGPSMRNWSSPAGANLSNLTNTLVPRSGPVTVWNNTWAPQTNTSVTPNVPYNKGDTWTYTRPNGAVTSTQENNPANYVGYQPLSGIVYNSANNIDQLYTDGNKSEEVITSKAIMYQGYFWDDSIIPQFGWRTDKTRQRGNTAPIFAQTGVASMNYRLTDMGVTMESTSTSYGITFHLPKSVKKQLPEGTDVSVFYFHGSNESPKVRYGIDTAMLPNEKGRTDDYGIQLDGFKGRASLRVTFFKTKDENAQASYGTPLGSAGWFIDSGPSWTLTMAAAGILASKGTPPDSGNSWLWGWGQSNPTLANQIAAAIQTEFPKLFPQSYWDLYGMPVSVDAIKRGDWANVVSNGQGPYPWSINNSHRIHGTEPIIDQNIVSKGYEIEGTFRPLNGWDVTFNLSKLNAYQTSLGSGATTYLNKMADLWLNTPIGLTPEWGGGPIRGDFLANVFGPYLTQVALTGTQQPELRKWNFRGVSNYTFNNGALKGLNVGGAYRWASKPILGFGVKKATILNTTAYISDVNQPRYGTIDSHFDLWVGYQRPLSKKLDWRVQVNLRNVGEKAHLTPISVEPDGTWAQQRIVQGMTFDISNKFMF